jgi:hypothetical protein
MKAVVQLVALLGFAIFLATQSQASSPVLEPGDVSLYGSILEKELLWSNDKSLTSDLQAIHSKSSGAWYFFDGKNRIDAKILGTPLKTDGSTVGFISAKSFAANGYMASCVYDPMGSSGAAGNFITAYLILNAFEHWSVFTFYSQDGCDSVKLSPSGKINFQYHAIDLKKPGRVTIHNTSIDYKDQRPILITLKPNGRTLVNPFVRKYFYFLKDSFIKQK